MAGFSEVSLHEETHYKHNKNEDGSFSAFDLRDADQGDVLAVHSDKETHLFIKEVGEEGDNSALENWRAATSRGLGSAVKLVLLEPNKSGSSFLTHGVVLKNGMELGVIDQEVEPKERQMRNLGNVARIGHMQALDIDPSRLDQPQVA